MRHWRSAYWRILAMVALLASVMPSSAWACLADDCSDHTEVLAAVQSLVAGIAPITEERCQSSDCAKPDVECCKPLQLPAGHKDKPATPTKSDAAISSISLRVDIDTTATIYPAVLSTAPAVIAPRYGLGFEPPGSSVSYLSRCKSPPLSGRSPPTT